MDLSKIPGKQGETPGTAETRAKPVIPVAAAEPPPRPIAPVDTRYRGDDVWYSGPEMMFAIGVGVIIGFLTPRFFSWLMHVVTGSAFTWTFTNTDGSPLAYTRSDFFIADVPVGLIVVGMIVEGIAMGVIKKRAVGLLASGLLLAAGVTAVAAQLYLMPRVGAQIWLLLTALMGLYLGWAALLRLKGVPR